MGTAPAEGELTRGRRQATDFLLVVVAWIAIIVSAAALPVDDHGWPQTALFVHLICVPIGFGAMVMTNVYTVLWCFGRRSLRDVLSLAGVAHQLMAVGLGGLIASGIALNPDLQGGLMRVKLALLLVVMLNAVRMQRLAGRIETLASGLSGENVPWRAFRNVLGTALVSQIAWWSVIVIGFLINTSRPH